MTTKNNPGYLVMSLVMYASLVFSVLLVYLASANDFGWSWNVSLGVLTSLLAAAHLTFLMVSKYIFTDGHKLHIFTYMLYLLAGAVAAVFTLINFSSTLRWQTKLMSAMFCMELPARCMVFVALTFNGNQEVQDQLHPYLESTGKSATSDQV